MLNLSSVLAGGGAKSVGVADDDSALGFLLAITGQVESGKFANVDKLYCKHVIIIAVISLLLVHVPHVSRDTDERLCSLQV